MTVYAAGGLGYGTRRGVAARTEAFAAQPRCVGAIGNLHRAQRGGLWGEHSDRRYVRRLVGWWDPTVARVLVDKSNGCVAIVIVTHRHFESECSRAVQFGALSLRGAPGDCFDIVTVPV